MDNVFVATLLSALRELARAQELQGTEARLDLERIIAAIELQTPALATTLELKYGLSRFLIDDAPPLAEGQS